MLSGNVLVLKATHYWEINMSILKYFSVILVGLAATVCQAEIGIEALAPEETRENLSAPSDATPSEVELKAEPLRLAIGLVDGSHIIGVPSITSVPLQTSYARMDVPMEKIASSEIGDDHETASFELNNGDKLTGVSDIRPIELQTIFGNVRVGIDHIDTVRTIHGGMLRSWDFDGRDVAGFTTEPPGGFSEAKGRAKPSAYGTGEGWHGPKATFPLTLHGDFHLNASINYHTEGAQMGRIALGVTLGSGTILKFLISDSHTATIEHSMSFFHGSKSVWSSGIKKSNETFSEYPISIERSGDVLRCLVGDRLVATYRGGDASAVTQLFFTIEQYARYPALTEASIGRISLLRPNE
jgi:hypothetical protein